MRKIYISIMAALALLLFNACDSLDLAPEDYYASGNFWKTEAQVDGFLLGLHADLRTTYGGMMFTLGEARGGTQRLGTSSQNTSIDMSTPVKNNAFTKDLTGISNWMGLYNNILQVNLLIQELTDGTDFLSQDQKNYYLAQAYGLRAFYYFYLYRTFGGVPLITQVKVMSGRVVAQDLYTARATAKATLDFIKEDVNNSETAFGSQTNIKSNKGQWSYYATQMLKAEIYLWSAKVTTGDQSPATTDLATAETAVQNVLNASSQFGLMDNYADVFKYANKGNKEVLFAIRYMDGEATNFMSLFSYQIPLFVNTFYDRSGNLITTDVLQIISTVVQRHEYKWGFFASFDDADSRKRGIFYDYYQQNGSPAGTVVVKYNGIVNSNGNRSWSDDFVVYRYAEALLLMAEVKNMQGQAVDTYINQIRQRAYGSNYVAATHAYTNGSFAENELAILKERDKEFVLEGKRWFDIRRMHDANHRPLAFSAAVNYEEAAPVISPSNPHLLLWPIDVYTLNNDPELTQNEGYTN